MTFLDEISHNLRLQASEWKEYYHQKEIELGEIFIEGIIPIQEAVVKFRTKGGDETVWRKLIALRDSAGQKKTPGIIAQDLWLDFQFYVFIPEPGEHCCTMMAFYVLSSPAVSYSELSASYFFYNPGKSPSEIPLSYCPWCGKLLPEPYLEEGFSEYGFSNKIQKKLEVIKGGKERV
jgi:hypothetical protein